MSDNVRVIVPVGNGFAVLPFMSDLMFQAGPDVHIARDAQELGALIRCLYDTPPPKQTDGDGK